MNTFASLALTISVTLTACTATEQTFKTQPSPDVGLGRDINEDVVTLLPDAPAETPRHHVLADVPPRLTGDVWTPTSTAFVLRDQETGSHWNVRGEAFDGPLAGTRLAQLPAFTAFWFAWSTFNHGGEVWNGALNEPGAIEGSGACEVPCDPDSPSMYRRSGLHSCAGLRRMERSSGAVDGQCRRAELPG